jgi:hypothetical protein
MQECLEHEADARLGSPSAASGLDWLTRGIGSRQGVADEIVKSHNVNCLMVAFGAIYQRWAADEDVLEV